MASLLSSSLPADAPPPFAPACAARLRRMKNEMWSPHPLRPSSVAAVNGSSWWVSTHGHTQPHCQTEPVSEVHSYLPVECPELSISAAARCLQQQGLRRVNFIGDSVSHQLAFTIACELGLTDITRVGETNVAPGVTLRVLRLPVGLELGFLWAEPQPQGTAAALDLALRSAISHGHLQEPALWMVNAGLWHMLCDAECTTAGAFKQKQADYRAQLHSLLEVLQTHTQGRGGRIVWRDTTAVHPSRMNKDVPEHVRHKFAMLTSANVRLLNRDAENVLTRFPAVSVLNHFFAATKDRAGGTAPGDIRHWKADVLRLLLHLGYLEWCGVLGERARNHTHHLPVR